MSLDILCIDDNREFLIHLKLQLENLYQVKTALDFVSGMDIIKQQEVDVVLLDIRLGEIDGLTVLEKIKQKYPSLPVIMLTAVRNVKTVVRSIQLGAAHYICKPFETEELVSILNKIEEVKNLQEQKHALISTINNNYAGIQMVGRSPKFKHLIEQASRLKGHSANVLIEGDSGTGKELLARYIHSLERDTNRPFIAINCAAIPEYLVESELFGHEKGAFTGAVVRKIGKFELANGGDIFLDEISSLQQSLQAKILRALQEHSFSRVGGNQQIHSNFRIIAAANVNLEGLVEKKAFRMDLFHRLRVVHLHIPSLKERRDDIPELVAIFLTKHSQKGVLKTFADCAMAVFMQYTWPGNIRELENLIQSLIIMSPGKVITKSDLPKWFNIHETDVTPKTDADSYLSFEEYEHNSLKEFVRMSERKYIEYVLRKNGGDRFKAAKELDTARSTFYFKLKEYGID